MVLESAAFHLAAFAAERCAVAVIPIVPEAPLVGLVGAANFLAHVC